MSNKNRGEVDITLKGKKYTMQPTFDACVEFEDMANVSIVETLMHWTKKEKDASGKPKWSGNVRMQVLAAAIYTGIKGHSEARGFNEYPTYEAVGLAIMEASPQALFPTVFQYLAGSIAGEADIAERLDTEGKDSSAA